ncbi:hypothetical protein SLEP1_g58039 [Rubroshorea leprosula]|uniref:PPM-type phosphatase domain-containing protein n=1 Tax=Rubroshorea leprosula TaxID=152421 RepID=A0AAV5MQF6_9ROSI|nr:hypothetical protein SLEP1_g58039 [Rubroshorea leprosula]
MLEVRREFQLITKPVSLNLFKDDDQGEHLVIANVGSRVVLATTSDDGSLAPLQLTVDFKPNIPEEAERITQSKGRVFCLRDELGVYRVWMPNAQTTRLAISRAFGDYCVKDFGLISVPDDVISNQEAVKRVSSTKDREKSSKRLLEFAAHPWKYKRQRIAMDDMSAICLFFHPEAFKHPNPPSRSLKEATMSKAR